MARPDTNHAGKRQEIVEAALRTFARHGYEGTTNKLVAKEANGISPALIYHYFPDGKQQLFKAIWEQLPSLKLMGEVIQQNQDAPLEDFLRSVVQTYVSIFRNENFVQIARIAMAEAPRQPELVQIILAELGPHLLLPMISYLQKQMKLGRITPMPPLVGPLQLFGPLFLRALIPGVVAEGHISPAPIPNEEEMVAHLVHNFLYGVLKEPPNE